MIAVFLRSFLNLLFSLLLNRGESPYQDQKSLCEDFEENAGECLWVSLMER